MRDEDIIRQFSYHAPHGDQAQRYAQMNELFLNCALDMAKIVSASPERTLALRDLQRARMWGNSSIAINEAPQEIDPNTLYPEVLLSGEPGGDDSRIKRDALTRLNQLQEQAEDYGDLRMVQLSEQDVALLREAINL